MQLKTEDDPQNASQYNVCIIKHSPSQVLQWVLQLGSNITEGQPEIVTDKAGNSYISFWFAKEFDIKINGIKTTLTPIGASSKTNAFIKIDTDGNVLWAHTLGGRSWNYYPKLTITDDNKIV